jgi:transposase InsO family protein
MMMDADIVAVSPSSVYRVLTDAGLLQRWNRKPSRKGTGFNQPVKAHEHWHIDISYINICGTFYYLCSILDGFSRYIVHWEIREAMKESDVEIILQRAREKFPDARLAAAREARKARRYVSSLKIFQRFPQCLKKPPCQRQALSLKRKADLSNSH